MHRRSLLAGASLALPAIQAQAQGAPGPAAIQLVTGFGPGGGTDVGGALHRGAYGARAGWRHRAQHAWRGRHAGPARIAQSRPDGYVLGSSASPRWWSRR